MADSESGVGLMPEVLDAALVGEEASMAKTPSSRGIPSIGCKCFPCRPITDFVTFGRVLMIRDTGSF
jgi:hypothetical protein